MFFKIANLFIWWNGQTIGTFLYTKFFGVFVGGDEYGNTYFTTTDGKKRWVNYKGDCNASSMSLPKESKVIFCFFVASIHNKLLNKSQ